MFTSRCIEDCETNNNGGFFFKVNPTYYYYYYRIVYVISRLKKYSMIPQFFPRYGRYRCKRKTYKYRPAIINRLYYNMYLYIRIMHQLYINKTSSVYLYYVIVKTYEAKKQCRFCI